MIWEIKQGHSKTTLRKHLQNPFFFKNSLKNLREIFWSLKNVLFFKEYPWKLKNSLSNCKVESPGDPWKSPTSICAAFAIGASCSHPHISWWWRCALPGESCPGYWSSGRPDRPPWADPAAVCWDGHSPWRPEMVFRRACGGPGCPGRRSRIVASGWSRVRSCPSWWRML